MLHGGHDLNLATDSNEVGLGLDLGLLDRLDGNLVVENKWSMKI